MNMRRGPDMDMGMDMDMEMDMNIVKAVGIGMDADMDMKRDTGQEHPYGHDMDNLSNSLQKNKNVEIVTKINVYYRYYRFLNNDAIVFTQLILMT